MAAFTLEELQSMVVVNIADYKLGHGDQTLITRDLGSCVGVAIHDPEAMIGGLLHIMLPEYKESHYNEGYNPAKYADTGIEEMMKDLVFHGASKSRLVAKIAGAAHVIKTTKIPISQDISSRNLEAVKNKLEELNIPILASEVGDDYPRTVVFETQTGKVRIVTSGRKDRIL